MKQCRKKKQLKGLKIKIFENHITVEQNYCKNK